LHAFPAWEDVQLKGANVATANQSPAPAAPAPSTPAESAAGEVSDVGDTGSDRSTFVVLGGVVTPARLQRSVSGYRNVPHIVGFSVQSAPKKTIKELATAGRFFLRSLSVTTVGELQEAGQSARVNIKVVRAPGHGFHSIVVTPRPLSDIAAQALSHAFRQMLNPSLQPQRR